MITLYLQQVRGVASAVISATRQFGSVLGVAVMGAMLTSGFHARVAAGEALTLTR